MAALDFAKGRFAGWSAKGAIKSSQAEAIALYYEQQRQRWVSAARAHEPPPAGPDLPPLTQCWNCTSEVGLSASDCGSCGMPQARPATRTLRYSSFLCHEVEYHQRVGRLSLIQAHVLLNETRERMAALRRSLEKERLDKAAALAAEAPSRPPAAPAIPRWPIWETLLDPRTIHWLLVFGAGLLVIGLVIWLYAAGVFENPLVVAGLMGGGTLALLAAGGAAVLFTRYQLAGRAVTLLACLIMPLNLWFYHAQQLTPFTLYEQLWVAAVAVCALYAVAAWVLRDPLFVYVLVAGVTMTGLLILADMDGPEEFWQITHPATLLVVLGLICLHAERAFPEAEGPFSRRRFGLPFFWSGHAVLAAGLLLVLGAQLVGYVYNLYADTFRSLGLKEPSPLTTETPLKVLALCLVLAGMYAYLYSDLLVRRIGVYIYLAVICLLWAVVLVVDLFQLTITEELVIVVLAVTALAANLAQSAVLRRQEAAAGARAESLAVLAQPQTRAVQTIGLVLSTLPVLLGLLLHLRATYEVFRQVWPHEANAWYLVGAMLVAAASCRISAHLYRHTMPGLATTYFFGTAAATLMAAAGFLRAVGMARWDIQAPLVMLIPILYVIAARLYQGHTQEKPLTAVAHAATAVMILAVVAAAIEAVPAHVAELRPPGLERTAVLVRGSPVNLNLAWFFAEATLFYILAGLFGRQGFNVYLGTAMACGAVWQLFNFFQVSGEYYTVTFALVGLALLIGYRFAVLESLNIQGLAGAAFGCANALISLGFVSGALLTLTELARRAQEAQPALIGTLLALMAISLLAVALVRDRAWRRWYAVTILAEAVLLILVLAMLTELTPLQKLELTSISIGLALLVASHVGWYREQERQSDLVTLGLALGSAMVALPFTIALVVARTGGPKMFDTWFYWLNEVGTLVSAVVILSAGFACQLRSTTIAGGWLLALYLLSMLFLIELPEQLKTGAVYLIIAGAVVFAAGLLLAIYRDRLLALPEMIKRRQGVFRVLSWR